MVAAQLFISLETVRSHVKKIYEKLQVNSKSEAVAKAFKDNII
jgi:DNA-binding CsgD family transcriptional regulator